MSMRQINYLVVAILGVVTVMFYLASGEIYPPSHIYPLTLIYLLGFLLVVMLVVNLFFAGAAQTVKPFANTRKRRVLGVTVASVVYNEQGH
ncbi:MAG: hypothetical protein ACOY9Y_05995 [Bacillota bacterium]